jgi:hypothetical protein
MTPLLLAEYVLAVGIVAIGLYALSRLADDFMDALLGRD